MTAVIDYLKVFVTKSDLTDVDVAPTMTGTMTFERGNRADLVDEFEPGPLSLDLLGPAVSGVVPRRRIAVYGKSEAGVFQQLWTGSLELPSVTYRKDAPPLTRFSAFDAMGFNARAKQQGPALHTGSTPRAVSWYIEEALKDRGYGYDVGHGSGDENAANTFDVDDTPETGRTRLDLLTRIRGEFGGSIWADRTGQRNVNYRGYDRTPPTHPMSPASDQLSDAATGLLYTQIDIGHSAGTFKNAVTFETSAGVSDGPYVDGASVPEWERQDITIPTLTAGAGGGFNALYWLRLEPLPMPVVTSFTFDALKNRRAFTTDPIDRLITVKHAESGINASYIITKEAHQVTATSWFVTYYVKPWATRTVSVVQTPVT